ncbi:hypothetical protein THAOC_26143, partial [Thalassiosira oceanica]
LNKRVKIIAVALSDADTFHQTRYRGVEPRPGELARIVEECKKECAAYYFFDRGTRKEGKVADVKALWDEFKPGNTCGRARQKLGDILAAKDLGMARNGGNATTRKWADGAKPENVHEWVTDGRTILVSGQPISETEDAQESG